MPSGYSVLQNLTFSSAEHGKLVFKKVQGADRHEEMLSVEASGTFGLVRIVEVLEEHYSIRLYSFSLLEDMTFYADLAGPYVGVIINLGSNVGYTHGTMRGGTLKNKQCGMVCLPSGRIKSRLYRGLTYCFIGVAVSFRYVRQSEERFLRLGSFLDKVERRIPVVEPLSRDGTVDIAGMAFGLHRHLAGGFGDKAFRNSQVSALLQRVFEHYNAGAFPGRLYASDLEKLHKVRDFLLQHLDAAVTLKKISQDIGMNQFKLKNGFRKVFGRPVFKFYFEQRMQKAKELLEKSDKPVNEVAILVGYKNVSSFSTAFKKRFGYPPSALK